MSTKHTRMILHTIMDQMLMLFRRGPGPHGPPICGPPLAAPVLVVA